MASIMHVLVELPPLISVLVKITCVLAVGWLVHLLLLRCDPRWRMLLWRGVAMALVVVPVAAPLSYLQVSVARPPAPAPPDIPVVYAAGGLGGFGPTEEYLIPPALYAAPAVQRDFRPTFSITSWFRNHLQILLLSAWTCVMAVLAGRCVAAFVGIRKRIARSAPAPAQFQHLLTRVCTDLGCRKTVALRYSHDLATPFIAHFRAPVLVLPARMIESPRIGELPAVFAHEVSHLRSRDLLWMHTTRALSTILWFHPLVWRICNAHTAACERVCDAVAADYVGDTSSYSSTLARIALATLETVPAVGGLPMARSAEISARLRVLRRKVYSSPLARPRVTLAFVAGVVALAGLGGLKFTYAQTQASGKVVSETGAAETAGSSSVSAPTRIIHFPKDRSLGILSVQTGLGERFPIHMSFSQYGEWEYIGQAIGDVPVPAGRRIMLQASRAALADLSPLAALEPNDLQWLEIRAGEAEIRNPDETIMPHLQGLTGLKNLAIRYIDISARGLRFLEPLTSLRGLWIVPTSNRLTADAVTFTPELQNTDVAAVAKLRSLEVLSLSSRAVTDEGIAHLAKLQSLRQLRLWCPKVQGPGLAHLAKLPVLEYFQTNNVKLGDRGLAYLKGCTSLKRLELGRVGLTDAGLAHFSGMTRLEELWLVGDNITNRGLEHLKPLRRLKSLDLGGTRINANAVSYLKELKSLEDLSLTSATDMADMHLAQLSELKNLRSLSAGGNSGGPISDEGLLYLSQLQHLEELVVCGDRITARGIAHLASIPNLKRFSLLSETLDDDVFTAVATIRSLTQLNLFSYQGLTVTGLNQLNRLSGLKDLEVDVIQDNSGLDLSGLTGLESLNLGIRDPADREDSTLRDEDMACLANLTKLKRFLTSSRQAYLTDAGTSHLAGLTELDRLSVGGPQLTDTTLSYLSNMKKLKTLHVTGNFTDQGLRHLEGLDSLESLRIYPSRDFSQSALQRLRDRLPNLRYLDANTRRVTQAMGGMGGLGG